MAKKLASKKTRELMSPSEISEKGLSKDQFTPNWKGRVIILNPEKSQIAKIMGIETKGEFAVKVR